MPGIFPDGKYSITNAAHPAHALSVDYISVVARLGDQTTWTLKWHQNHGNYTITIDDGDDKVLDLIINKNNVIVHKDFGSANQRWTIVKNGPHYLIRNFHSKDRELGVPITTDYNLIVTGVAPGAGLEKEWNFTPKGGN
ncbi:hypothetical protein Q9L58_007996 [Maublancomyces gigas]|uniref:Ricin B lectin domain-containing protein n=1 Tax=Discina gigas TaxID=1032678 RepID=A0ABR3GAV6_9PEZI